MSNLNMPTLTVAFKQRAAETSTRSQKGIVALILRDAAANAEALTYVLSSAAQKVEALGTANQAAIKRAFIGNVNPARKVLVYVMAAADTITEDCAALTWLGLQKFDYLAGPDDLSAAEAGVLKDWVVTQRTENSATYKAVLPNVAANNAGIVNFVASGILVGDEELDGAAYCGRMAGLIAGTPMTQSVTYAALPEVTDIDRMSKEDMDKAVAAGKLILYHDGEKVKCGRGVNSLVTLGELDAVWQKIKLVELLDMIQQDIRLTVQDNYIGKFSNTYDNKVQLVTAISAYLQELAKAGLIESNFTCGIDVEAQAAWLEENGTDTTEMSEQDIKQANTGTHVFLQLAVRGIDAMEDVNVNIYL